MIYLALAASSFLYVFLRAFQQRNVTGNHYAMVLPISFLMAAGDVFLISTVAAKGFSVGLILLVGLFSGMGAMAAMRLHNRIYKPLA